MVISILIIAANSQMLHWNSFYRISSRRQRMHRPNASARTGSPFSENKEIKLNKNLFNIKRKMVNSVWNNDKRSSFPEGLKKFNMQVSNALLFSRSPLVCGLISISLNWISFTFRRVYVSSFTNNFNLLDRNLMHKIKDQRIWAKNSFYALLTCHNEYDISMTSTVAYFQC